MKSRVGSKRLVYNQQRLLVFILLSNINFWTFPVWFIFWSVFENLSIGFGLFFHVRGLWSSVRFLSVSTPLRSIADENGETKARKDGLIIYRWFSVCKSYVCTKWTFWWSRIRWINLSLIILQYMLLFLLTVNSLEKLYVKATIYFNF